METGFNDPIAVKDETKKIKSPFNFDCPQYDERSSCYVNAGSHYGVGHKQPVGHHGDPTTTASTLPQHQKAGMKVAEVRKKNEKLDLEL